MIGLISPNLASVNHWRGLTKVPPAISPWLSVREQILGMRFNAIICLPGWQERPGNDVLLAMARTLLLVPAPDPEDVEAERSTPATPVEEPNDGVSLTFIVHPTPVVRPNLGDEDDRAMARNFVTDDVYDRMTADERAHLISLIRAPGNIRGAILTYVSNIRRRLDDPQADAAVEDRRRQNRINDIIRYTGEGERAFLNTMLLFDIEALARRAQLIQVSSVSQAAEARALFTEHWRSLRELYPARQAAPRITGVVPTRPPTSGPRTGGRAVGRTIPFSDIFAPQRRRHPTEDDI